MVLDGMGMSSEVANNGAATSPSAREAVVSRREHRVVCELCRLDRSRRRRRRAATATATDRAGAGDTDGAWVRVSVFGHVAKRRRLCTSPLHIKMCAKKKKKRYPASELHESFACFVFMIPWCHLNLQTNRRRDPNLGPVWNFGTWWQNFKLGISCSRS